ncbi:amino acid transporter [Peribacillus deserti]|uniref:Amino acid transporter n=1 Tax=Peribacillus deserti TaxID=673318 RepID=A0ABS2QEU8_9BACI|nr:APC family permease [Peribacillus deserti]MBM7691667.1 amino acid transporter [Peribacillus deserti]
MAKAMKPKEELKRSLSFFGNISISVSDISPTTGVFLMVPAVLATAGTGTFISFLGAALIALCVALCMSELGALYPGAGGLYSIVYRVLGRPIGFLALLNYLIQGIFLPATIAFGAADYLIKIFPGWTASWTAFGVMAACTVVTILSMKWNAKFVEVFLFLELLVVGVIAVVAIFHPVQEVSSLFQPVMLSEDKSSIMPVSWSIVFAAVTVALFSYNGYDSSINFSEETDQKANIGKTLFTSALIGVLAQIIPLFCILLAVPDIKTFLSSPSPINYIGEMYMGKNATLFLNAGAAIAMINCVLAVILQFSRVYYSAGRDKAFPEKINKFLTTIHPTFKTPWAATLFMGALGAMVCFDSSLVSMVTFTSVTIVLLYATVALCVMVSRVRDKHLHRPFKLPLFPVIPIIALAGSIAALSQQSSKDLIISAIAFGAALLYYFLYLKPRGGTRWLLNGQKAMLTKHEKMEIPEEKINA